MFVTTHLEGEYSLVTAHPSYGILAGVSKDGAIVLLDEDLQSLSQSLPNTKTSPILRLCWHPTKKFLIIAWLNGSLGLWCVDAEGSVREGNLHSSPLSCIEWSPSGNRLITGDKDGAVVIWKVDTRGKLSNLSQYRLRGAINQAVFKTNIRKSNDSKFKDKEPPFFLGDSSGTIFFADDAGHCAESVCLPEKVRMINFHEGRDLLLVLTEDLLLSHFLLNAEGKLLLDTAWPQIKLGGVAVAGTKGNIQSLMIEPNMIAYSVNNSTPKVWDSENEETFFLEKQGLFEQDVSYLHIAFSKRNEILAVSTSTGHIILWSRILSGSISTWEPFQKIEILGIPTGINWGMGDISLCICKANGFQLLSEQILRTAGSKGDAFVSQIGAKKLLIENSMGKTQVLESQGKIKELSVSKDIMVIWTGSSLELYSLDGFLGVTFHSTVPCPTNQFSCSQSFVYYLNADRNTISINHLPSSTLFTIVLPYTDGDICAISTSDSRLHVFTTEKILKTFEIGKRDAKLILTRKLDSQFDNLKNLIIESNADGSFFGVLTTSDPNTLIVFCVENSQLFTHDCGSKIKTFCWDSKDPRILGAQIAPNGKENNQQSQIISFFATENQLVFKDIQNIPSNAETLVSISIPNHYYFKKTEFKAEQTGRFMSMLIKEYSGIEDLDETLIKTITDFSFKLAIGHLDDAARVVKLIKNEAVWENMSQVCIKMRRSKLARLCMGKLKNAKALRTISTLQKLKDDNALAAQFALHLGLYDEAKEMWSDTGNFAQLISFYQSAGEWENALEIASKKDRPSLPTTYFKFGGHLAETDKIGAIAAYEKSNSSRAQILRMMLSDSDELQKYVDLSKDKETKKWWAQNAESHGDIESALKYYTEIGDIFSIVRVHCRAGDLKKATELTDLHPENLISVYYVAREFEKTKNWPDAIAYYSKAKCYSSAIRIAKENKIDKELLQLALQSNSLHMSDVAKYFEKLGDLEKAINLYSKSGNVEKALALCYKTKNVSMMESIISHLDPVANESSLKRISQFLADNGSHESALRLLIVSQKFQEALDILEMKNVTISEDLYNSFKLPSTLNNDEEVKYIHRRMAALCMSQGEYQLACKSYTLAGDRFNAMSALLKSGDKDKIITFANVSRNFEIYTIAANYLQSLNWINDIAIMRTIIQFYTKAKAFGSLARFYVSCAQVEIDEFQNYKKALGALNEAEACQQKDTGGIVSNDLKMKKDAVLLFIQALEQGSVGDAEKCEQICAELLNFDGIDDFVRIGDILGLLIETNYKSGNIGKAKELFKRLQSRSVGVSVSYYVDEAICVALDDSVHNFEHYVDEENIH